MRIAYCTNVRLPSERAHGHQVARVCDALAKLGHEVTIFAPYRKNELGNDPGRFHQFHEADERVSISYVGSFDPINQPWLPKPLQIHVLNFLLKRNLRKTIAAHSFDLLYTRTPALLDVLLRTKKKVVLELHTLPNRGIEKFVEQCNRCVLVVCLTSPMKKELVEMGVSAEKVMVEPDAVDFEKFASVQPMPIDLPKPLIGYAGQLESMGLSKGIPELIGAAELLQRNGFAGRCVIAGPRSANETIVRTLRSPAVAYQGYLPADEVPRFLVACDVLVYPAPKSDHPFYNRDTSPLKIFEYMASGKPIVTADLPPIRDVLDEDSAFFCPPGDPQALAERIEYVLRHPEEAAKRAARAQEKVQHYTWDKRMKRIFDALP